MRPSKASPDPRTYLQPLRPESANERFHKASNDLAELRQKAFDKENHARSLCRKKEEAEQKWKDACEELEDFKQRFVQAGD